MCKVKFSIIIKIKFQNKLQLSNSLHLKIIPVDAIKAVIEKYVIRNRKYKRIFYVYLIIYLRNRFIKLYSKSLKSKRNKII